MWSLSDTTGGIPSAAVLATSLVTFVSGFMLGVYSIRGYLLISPALAEERRRNYEDPEESEASDIDEDDTTLDHAPNWANGVEADRRQGLRASAREETAKAVPRGAVLADTNPREECKLVLVVRTDLGMTKGKIAAQCSHATLACYKALSRAGQKSQQTDSSAASAKQILSRWERHGQPKIAVQTKGEDELLELQGKAQSLGITAEVIADAGRTQIDAGSLTVLGVGPAPKSLVDKVTGHLKLL